MLQNQVQAPGKVSRVFCPHFYACKMARGRHCSYSTCRAVMCFRCHNNWVDDSKEISHEEEAAKEERNKLDELEKKRKGGEVRGKERLAYEKVDNMSKKVGGRSRMASSRSNKNIMSDKEVTNHLPDDNCCKHDDISTWQEVSDFSYLQKSYRNGLIKRGKENELLDMECSRCCGVMPHGNCVK